MYNGAKPKHVPRVVAASSLIQAIAPVVPFAGLAVSDNIVRKSKKEGGEAYGRSS